MTTSRLIAAKVINDVSNGTSLTEALLHRLSTQQDERDHAFIQAICYGVCRYYCRLDVILSYLLQKPMSAKDSDVHALLLVGLYQLIDMRVPEHAAVAETVNAAKKLKKPWASGLVNAILREYLRKKNELNEKIKSDDEATYMHPDWWIALTKKNWGQQWQDILFANNEHPPMTLRVNEKQSSREAYLAKLKEKNISAQVAPNTMQGMILDAPVDVAELPGFNEGAVSIQDGAAQLAAALLAFEPGQHVLDACAAPGGKLMHILEIQPDASVIAIEKDQQRIESIHENLSRLSLSATVHCADAANVENWWDQQLFDRILLDAPCSASGVVRRHPDIKLLREPTDIKQLVKEQAKLLNALWPLLKPGGLLVYATCSIFKEENVEQMQAFLATHPDAREEPIVANWGIPCAIGRQILPGMDNMDGFYYARVRK